MKSKLTTKTIAIWFFSIIACITVVWSCKKNTELEEASNQLSVMELKKFVTGKTTEKVEWEKAVSIRLKTGSNILYVRITTSNEDYVNNAQRFLVAYKDSIQIKPIILVLNPTENKNYIINKSFFSSYTGDALIYDLNKTFLRGHFMTNWKITGEAKLERTNTSLAQLGISVSGKELNASREKLMQLNTKETMGWEESCEWRTVGNYVQNGTVYVVGRKFCTLSYKQPDTYLPPEEVIWWIAPEPEYNGWRDTGEEKTDSVDCAGVLNGSALESDECNTCIGGTTGLTACPKDIRNKTEDPCISTVVNELVGTNKNIEGKISEIIKKFDQSKDLNLNIYDGITANGKPGNMFRSQLIGSSFTADIRLQTSYFKGQDGASKESLAAVLIHEVLHSFIKSQNFNLLDTTNIHHNMMVQNYIAPMSDYLTSAFGISRKDAFSLVWNGVIDSDVFEKANSEKLFEYTYTENGANHTISVSKQEIMNRASAYNGNTNYADEGKKGTKTCPN